MSELGSEPDDLDGVALARGLVILAPDLAPEIVARLRAAAPAGLVVVDGGVAPRALAAASPELLIEVGRAELDVEVGVSPRASIGLVKIDDGGAPAEAPPHGAGPRPDLVWSVAPGSDPCDELIAAWGALR